MTPFFLSKTPVQIQSITFRPPLYIAVINHSPIWSFVFCCLLNCLVRILDILVAGIEMMLMHSWSHKYLKQKYEDSLLLITNAVVIIVLLLMTLSYWATGIQVGEIVGRHERGHPSVEDDAESASSSTDWNDADECCIHDHTNIWSKTRKIPCNQ